MEHYSASVLGGGLGGILTALRLSRAIPSVVLVDNQLPAAKGQLGGFAQFAGAKFSLPPAGMGLLPLAGSEAALKSAVVEVLGELRLAERIPAEWLSSPIPTDSDVGISVKGRGYYSIVLPSDEVQQIIARTVSKLDGLVNQRNGKCTSIVRSEHSFDINLDGPSGQETISADAVFVAIGRGTTREMLPAELEQTDGKGIDVGVRVEFYDRTAFASLNSVGADAKLLSGSCRTFCINSPGAIYRYDFGSIPIAGGIVVDDPSHQAGNFGILCRQKDKRQMLVTILKQSPEFYLEPRHSNVDLFSSCQECYGQAVASEIRDFVEVLSDNGFVDFAKPHRWHLPLMDWHWPTFGRTGSCETNVPGLYVVGDAAGHARGILQAAISGWLAAKEHLDKRYRSDRSSRESVVIEVEQTG
jgi:hypothetical protein